MDAQHFDAIARALAATGSRRPALSGLLAAALLGPERLVSAKRKRHQQHKRDKDHSAEASGKGKKKKKRKKGKNKDKNKEPTPQPPPVCSVDGNSCGTNRFCKAGVCVDYGFLATLKLPWCEGDREPRTLQQDWQDGHAAGGIPAIGFALDFGKSAQGDVVLGTPILAPLTGTLKQLPFDDEGFGNHVRIDGDNGWQVILAHLDQPSPIADNTAVQRGDIVGTLGNSGHSSGAHIHVEIRFNGQKPSGLFGSEAGNLPLYGYERDDFTFGNGKTFSSAQHCGTNPCEGVDCSGLPHVQDATCQDGQCVIASCKPGFADCDENPNTGCETELGTVNACQACGDRCEERACNIATCNQELGCGYLPLSGDTCQDDGVDGTCINGECVTDSCAGAGCICTHVFSWEFASNPWAVVVDDNGQIYVTLGFDNRVLKLAEDGTVLAEWGRQGSGAGEFDGPEGIALDGNGNVFVVDNGNHRIQKFTDQGEYIDQWGSLGSESGEFLWPTGIAINSQGHIFVVDTNNYRIQKFTEEGAYLDQWGEFGTGNGQFDIASNIAIDHADHVYVTDSSNFSSINHRVQKFTSDGGFLTKWGRQGSGNGEFQSPSGIAIDANDDVYVVEGRCYNSGSDFTHGIQKFTSDGTYLGQCSERGLEPHQLLCPTSLAIDGRGNIYVGDQNAFYMLRKFAPVDAAEIAAERAGGKGAGKRRSRRPERSNRDRKKRARNQHEHGRRDEAPRSGLG